MAGLSDISPVVMGNKLTQNQPHPTPPHPNLTQPYPTPTPPHPNPTQPNCTLRRDGFVLPVPTFAFPCQWEPFEAVSTWVREIRMWVRKAEKREREKKEPGTKKLCIQRRRLEFRGQILLFLNSLDILLLRRSCSFSRHFCHFYFIYYLLPSYFSSWFIFRWAPSFIRIPSSQTRFRLISLILWPLICIYIIF